MLRIFIIYRPSLFFVTLGGVFFASGARARRALRLLLHARHHTGHIQSLILAAVLMILGSFRPACSRSSPNLLSVKPAACSRSCSKPSARRPKTTTAERPSPTLRRAAQGVAARPRFDPIHVAQRLDRDEPELVFREHARDRGSERLELALESSRRRGHRPLRPARASSPSAHHQVDGPEAKAGPQHLVVGLRVDHRVRGQRAAEGLERSRLLRRAPPAPATRTAWRESSLPERSRAPARRRTPSQRRTRGPRARQPRKSSGGSAANRKIR